ATEEAVTMWQRNAVRSAYAAMSVVLLALTGAAHCYAQTTTLRIGVLTFDNRQPWFKPFEATLAKHGWIPGKNLHVDYRNAAGDVTGFKAGAEELARSDVQVIFAMSAPAVHATRAATRTIPIVGMDYTTDVLAAGSADSYGQPGQNLT